MQEMNERITGRVQKVQLKRERERENRFKGLFTDICAR